MLGGLIENLRKGDIQSFEEFYILTYDTLYSYAWILTGTQRDKAKELLIKTYCYVYDYRSDMPEEDRVYAWLYTQMDEAAMHHFDITEEMIDEIIMQEEDHEAVIKLSEETAASILLIIEERLELLEEHEETLSRNKKIFSGIKLVLACFFFGGTLWLLSLGVRQLADQLSFLKNPLVETMPDQVVISTTEEAKPKYVKIGTKIVYLSEIGQVLYSLPLEESDLADKTPYNQELQESETWEYYLPSPEREDSVLGGAASSMAHTLYRMNKQSKEWELVAREVQDYAVYEANIYTEQYGRIQVMDEDNAYEKLDNRLVYEAKEDGIYISYLLGSSLPTDPDGMIQIEDRLYQMEGNKILSVAAAECREGQNVWYLDYDSGVLYQSINGQEQVFEKQGKRIDSFCRSGDWIYYSVHTKNSSSGKYYSRIYRKGIHGGAAESVTGEFVGNIYHLHYSDEARLILGEYVADSWVTQSSLIAVLTPEGELSTLPDPAQLPERPEGGPGYLRYIINNDTNAFCLWGDVPVTLPLNSRTVIK